jgi:SARP family transcriptional regulator, regulator of embCAB operon
MRYEIIGPLRITDGDSRSFITARKVETLLAVLLVRSDEVVTHDQLVSEIWGENPPLRATAGLHVYVSQLRKFLHRQHRGASPVVTRSSGYLLHLGHDQLDLHCFLRLTDLGRSRLRAGRPEEAREAFEGALTLWRGPSLGDLRRGPILEGFESWLRERRLECLEMLVDTQLHLGRHRESVSLLVSLIAENPLREVFYHRLMLALYRSHRTADALEVFHSARTMLHDELGLEPCRALRDLHHAILRNDDELELVAV